MEKQLKLLISTEDGEWGREPMQRLAEKGGVAVFVKRDGTELIRRIKDEKPQVVLMDMFMPGYDAMGVMHAISEDTATEKPMYIVAASCPMPSLERELINQGATYFAISPFNKSHGNPSPDRRTCSYKRLPLSERFYHDGHRGS